MNPYRRFQFVTGAVSGALVLAVVGLLARQFLNGPLTPEALLTLGALVAASVVIWFSLAQNMLPLVMRHSGVRKIVLGTQHVEGTWVQAEKSDAGQRVAVINIRPNGEGFSLTGYAMNENFDVVSNLSIDFAKLEWPCMSFKYRNTLVDFDDPHRDGFGELQFEMSAGRPRRYNGFCKLASGQDRYGIEGARIADPAELEMLDTLEGREDLVEKYWELFFERDARREDRIAQRKARREARRAERATSTTKAPTRDGSSPESDALELRKRVETAFSKDLAETA